MSACLTLDMSMIVSGMALGVKTPKAMKDYWRK